MGEAAPDLWHQNVSHRGGDPLWLTTPTDKIEAAFAQFHRANPVVYQELEIRALRLAEVAKLKRFGIAWIFEAMRYDRAIATAADDWKLNNNYRALYARLLLHHQPHLSAKLELRERHPGKYLRA